MPASPAASDVGPVRAVAVRGFAASAGVADLLSEPEDAIEAALKSHAAVGRLTHRAGRISGWSVTADGKRWLAERLAEQREDPRTAGALRAAYGAFLEFNEPIKQLCTDWQLGGQPSGCVKRLADLHRQVDDFLDRLATAAPWFGRYGDRLRSALARLQAGDNDAFTKPLSGSYHDVWMELHQDLLLALGRARDDRDGY